MEQHVIFGCGTIGRVGELTRRYGGDRALLVTDPGIRAAGILEQVVTTLENAGIMPTVFADVTPNPTTADVDAAVAAAQDAAPVNVIIGLGGGSAMDCAKGANFLLTNGGKIRDYWGSGTALKPMLPSIGVPTTIGTGSEAQSYALIADAETHVKMACGDKKARFRSVILDPILTETLPRSVAAITAIDAIAHAVESFVSTRQNLMSRMFAQHAWQLLDRHFEGCLQPNSTDARGQMLFGAYLAGLAIEYAMLGAAHACANPLTARYNVTHGVAVGLMLPHVIRFNSAVAGDAYRTLYPTGDLADRITALKQVADLPNTFQEWAVQSMGGSTAGTPDISALAAEAGKQWTAQFNPRTLEVHDFVRLYEQIIS